ncbi:hypothetical protein JCM10213_006615 [Rhodosporidiobolus nylandii]
MPSLAIAPRGTRAAAELRYVLRHGSLADVLQFLDPTSSDLSSRAHGAPDSLRTLTALDLHGLGGASALAAASTARGRLGAWRFAVFCVLLQRGANPFARDEDEETVEQCWERAGKNAPMGVEKKWFLEELEEGRRAWTAGEEYEMPEQVEEYIRTELWALENPPAEMEYQDEAQEQVFGDEPIVQSPVDGFAGDEEDEERASKRPRLEEEDLMDYEDEASSPQRELVDPLAAFRQQGEAPRPPPPAAVQSPPQQRTYGRRQVPPPPPPLPSAPAPAVDPRPRSPDRPPSASTSASRLPPKQKPPTTDPSASRLHPAPQQPSAQLMQSAALTPPAAPERVSSRGRLPPPKQPQQKQASPPALTPAALSPVGTTASPPPAPPKPRISSASRLPTQAFGQANPSTYASRLPPLAQAASAAGVGAAGQAGVQISSASRLPPRGVASIVPAPPPPALSAVSSASRLPPALPAPRDSQSSSRSNLPPGLSSSTSSASASPAPSVAATVFPRASVIDDPVTLPASAAPPPFVRSSAARLPPSASRLPPSSASRLPPSAVERTATAAAAAMPPPAAQAMRPRQEKHFDIVLDSSSASPSPDPVQVKREVEHVPVSAEDADDDGGDGAEADMDMSADEEDVVDEAERLPNPALTREQAQQHEGEPMQLDEAKEVEVKPSPAELAAASHAAKPKTNRSRLPPQHRDAPAQGEKTPSRSRLPPQVRAAGTASASPAPGTTETGEKEPQETAAANDPAKTNRSRLPLHLRAQSSATETPGPALQKQQEHEDPEAATQQVMQLAGTSVTASSSAATQQEETARSEAGTPPSPSAESLLPPETAKVPQPAHAASVSTTSSAPAASSGRSRLPPSILAQPRLPPAADAAFDRDVRSPSAASATASTKGTQAELAKSSVGAGEGDGAGEGKQDGETKKQPHPTSSAHPLPAKPSAAPTVSPQLSTSTSSLPQKPSALADTREKGSRPSVHIGMSREPRVASTSPTTVRLPAVGNLPARPSTTVSHRAPTVPQPPQNPLTASVTSSSIFPPSSSATLPPRPGLGPPANAPKGPRALSTVKPASSTGGNPSLSQPGRRWQPLPVGAGAASAAETTFELHHLPEWVTTVVLQHYLSSGPSVFATTKAGELPFLDSLLSIDSFGALPGADGDALPPLPKRVSVFAKTPTRPYAMGRATYSSEENAEAAKRMFDGRKVAECEKKGEKVRWEEVAAGKR